MAIDWKLLFHQLFALEIRKEFVLAAPEGERDDVYTRLLNAFVQYSPRSFGELIEETMAAGSPEEAYEIRSRFYEHPVNRALIRDLDFSRSIDGDHRVIPEISTYLATIERHQGRAISSEENFFASEEGKNVARAFAFDGDSNDQSVALVMIPGYAAHTIPYAIFEEFVADANTYYGRPAERPLLEADGIDLTFEDAKTFYGRGEPGRPVFDVLHPAGLELGNTTGHNLETTDLIADWVRDLPERYAETKLIFLGYSKGAPIVLDIVHRHPDLAGRTLGFVTHAGALQGAHAARLFLEQAESVLREVSMADFVARLREEDPVKLAAVISPIFSQLDMSWLSLPRIREVFESLGVDTSDYERQAERLLGGREVREILDGVRDLSPQERARWSLVHLRDQKFPEPTYIFNLSALADVRDFVRPVDPTRGGAVGPSLVAPTFDDEGKIDWEHLSIDALVLYFTSLAGFRAAPGGLFDTQVDLASSKTMLLDTRPLCESLRPSEIDALWEDEDVRSFITEHRNHDRQSFANTPRSQLIPVAERANIDAIDLGEFRGHHWSLFKQALRPPQELSETHALWRFPRKAYMRALAQVLALRNLVDAQSREAVS